jgi:hypothetical protein
MMLVLAPKSSENTLNITKKEKKSIQLGDEIHAQISTILRESNVYKVWKPPQHPPTL